MTDFKQTQFYMSAPKLKLLPADQGAEIAFIGRSNSGKSHALNAITEKKNLARVSKTPGRTQMINVFIVQPGQRLMDLPGYGYAKVSHATQNLWAHLVNGYLQKRQSLKGLVLVMDCRHPLKPLDLQLLDWTQDSQIPVHILLTKADKLRFSGRKKTLQHVEYGLQGYRQPITVQLFSATASWGVEQARQQLTNWYSCH